MCGDTLFRKQPHQAVGQAVINDALAQNSALLFAVEGRRVVLVGDDAERLVRRCIDLFCLALVELDCFFHRAFLRVRLICLSACQPLYFSETA